MKTISLNVNNFGGAKEEKPRWDEYKKKGLSWQEYDSDRKAFQQNGDRITVAEKIANRLKDHDGDIVVLSEFDIAAPAGEAFIKYFAGYELVVPIGETNDGKILEKAEDYGPTYSITVILVKKVLFREGIRREMAPEGRADLNLIKLDSLTIFGVHAKPPSEKGPGNFGVLKTWAIESAGDTEKILIIGDFNTYEGNDNCPATRDAYRGILLKGFIDLCPEGVPTFTGETCIDHALVSPALGGLAKKGKVDCSFIEDGLSDHAAVIVDLDL